MYMYIKSYDKKLPNFLNGYLVICYCKKKKKTFKPHHESINGK